MTITQHSNGAKGAVVIATGDYLDSAGSPAAAAIACGFIPAYVKLINLTDTLIFEWFDGMTAGHALKTDASGNLTELSSGGFTPEAIPATAGSGTSAGTNSPGGVVAPLGFSFGTIVQNKQYYWFATA